MKHNKVYLRYPNGVHTWVEDNYYSTAEEKARYFIENENCVIVTEKEHNEWVYKTCFDRMKAAIDSENIGEVWSILISNDNKSSIKAFSEITGVTLSKKQGERLQQIRDFYGEKFIFWNEEQARLRREKREARDAEETARHNEFIESAIKHWKDGGFIPTSSFLILCSHCGIELHPRTKGYLNKWVNSVNSKHQYYKVEGAGRSTQLYDIVRQLNKALGI